jgi:hypothetical protein
MYSLINDKAMTEETLKRATELRKEIENAVSAKDCIANTVRYEMRDWRNYNQGAINIDEKGNVYFENTNVYFENTYELPEVLRMNVREEFIKATHRAKHLLNNYIFDLKKELEDL